MGRAACEGEVESLRGQHVLFTGTTRIEGVHRAREQYEPRRLKLRRSPGPGNSERQSHSPRYRRTAPDVVTESLLTWAPGFPGVR